MWPSEEMMPTIIHMRAGHSQCLTMFRVDILVEEKSAAITAAPGVVTATKEKDASSQVSDALCACVLQRHSTLCAHTDTTYRLEMWHLVTPSHT